MPTKTHLLPLACFYFFSLAYNAACFELMVEVKKTENGGEVNISWRAQGLEQQEFAVLYGLGGGGGDGQTKGTRLDNVPCCEVTVNHLRGHSLYTFKVEVAVDDKVLSSAPKEIHIGRGVPHAPYNITVESRPDNSTHVAWVQENAAEIQYYNVSLVLDNGQIHWTQSRRPECSFASVAATAWFDVGVVAVNPSGPSQKVTVRHYAQEAGSPSGGKRVSRSNLFWAILAPVILVLALPVLIAAGIHINRRRSHSNILASKDDNGLSYMPLRLSQDLSDSQERRPSRVAATPRGDAGESARNNIRPTSLQELRSEVNRIGRLRETSPHKAQFQLVSESPHLQGRVPAGRSSLSASLMSTPTGSPRTSKRTPIIPLSEEKLLSRVNTDPSRYLSWRLSSSES